VLCHPAINAACIESISNPTVTLHLIGLKTLKRAMYGQAGAELLRARLLPLEVTE